MFGARGNHYKHDLIEGIRRNICRLKRICEEMGLDTPRRVETSHASSNLTRDQLRRMYQTARQEEYFYRTLRDRGKQRKRRRYEDDFSQVKKTRETFKEPFMGYHSDDTLCTNFDDDEDSVIHSPPPLCSSPRMWGYQQEVEPALAKCKRASVIVPRPVSPATQAVLRNSNISETKEAGDLQLMASAIFRAAEENDIKTVIMEAKKLLACYDSTEDDCKTGNGEVDPMVDDTVHDQAKNSVAPVFDEAVRMTDYNEGHRLSGIVPAGRADYNAHHGLISAVPAGVGVSYGPVMYAPIEITGSNDGDTAVQYSADQVQGNVGAVFDEAVGMTHYNEDHGLSNGVPAGVGLSLGPVIYAPMGITGSNGGDTAVQCSAGQVQGSEGPVYDAAVGMTDYSGDHVVLAGAQARCATAGIMGSSGEEAAPSVPQCLGVPAHHGQDGRIPLYSRGSFLNPRILLLPEALKVYEELKGFVLVKTIPDGTCQFQSHSLAARFTTFTQDICEALDQAMVNHKEEFHFTKEWVGLPLELKYGKGRKKTVRSMEEYEDFLRSKKALTMWRTEEHIIALCSLTNTEVVVYECRANGIQVPRKWYYPTPRQDIHKIQDPDTRIVVRFLYSGNHYDLLVRDDHPIVHKASFQNGRPTGVGSNGILPIAWEHSEHIHYVREENVREKNEEPKFQQIKNHLEGNRPQSMFKTLIGASSRSSVRNKMFHEDEKNRRCDLLNLSDSLSLRCNLGYFNDQGTTKQIMEFLMKDVLLPNLKHAAYNFQDRAVMQHYVETVLFPHSVISYIRMQNQCNFESAEKIFQDKNRNTEDERLALEMEIQENQDAIEREKEEMEHRLEENKIMRERIRKNEDLKEPYDSDVAEEALRILNESTDCPSNHSFVMPDQADVIRKQEVVKVFGKNEGQEDPSCESKANYEDIKEWAEVSKEKTEEKVDEDTDSSSSDSSSDSDSGSSSEDEDTKGTQEKGEEKGGSSDDLIMKINEYEAIETLGKQDETVSKVIQRERSGHENGKDREENRAVEMKREELLKTPDFYKAERYGHSVKDKKERSVSNKDREGRRAVEERTPPKRKPIHFDGEKHYEDHKRAYPHHVQRRQYQRHGQPHGHHSSSSQHRGNRSGNRPRSDWHADSRKY